MNSDGELFAVKMRSSRAGKHISGAERIVAKDLVPKVAQLMVKRAFDHSRGGSDFVNIKIESQKEDILHLAPLEVSTIETHSAEEGMEVAAQLLMEVGITRADEIMAMFAETYAMRGAMLVDADTLERLESDPLRGVRATYMDSGEACTAGADKNHYAEALVLATKVQAAPGIVGEICVSDDPDYVTGYVATKGKYQRITVMKNRGEAVGGRIFLYRGARERVAETVEFIEKKWVQVDGVPSLAKGNAHIRFDTVADEMNAIKTANLERRCVVRQNGFVDFASNDYLDLANDDRLKQAAVAAITEFGVGSTGSRLISGTLHPHVSLECRLAAFKSTEDAVVWATGYMANVGTITALARKGDVILSDELNHASIIDGCRMSGAEVIVYRHRDMEDLSSKLKGCCGYGRRLVVSDAVFSMDGDIAPLPDLLDICERTDSFLMVDEAHSTGVIGKTGRGICEHFGCAHPDILMGTLSKALGSEGGYVCTTSELADFLRNKSRSFIFSTAPSAGTMAAATAALDVLEREPWRVERIRENVRTLVEALVENGIETSSESSIVPVVIGDEALAVKVSAKLRDAGFLVPAVRYPTVAKGSARLRLSVKSCHVREELLAVARTIKACLNRD